MSTEQAKASALQSEITSTGQQIDALDQQYDAAESQLGTVDGEIAATEAQIATTKSKISKDRQTVKTAAVNAYVTGGSAGTSAIFTSNQTASANAQVFDQVVTGNLTGSMDRLNTAVNQLDAQHKTLKTEEGQATQAVAAAKQATQAAQTLLTQQRSELSQVNGKIATLVAQAAAAQAAAQAAAAQAALATAAANANANAAKAHSTSTYVPPPPPASGNAGTVAVAAAESQLGVPYVWGAETPGNGFDCSGLVAWAWGQAGVSLPHYSGSQMADSTPVPITDLQPGDLLFYGAGGSQHVAMYIGGGQVIEAPHTGTVVRIDPARIGTSEFAGAGRP